MQLLTTIAVKWSRRTHFEIITCGELGGLVKRATTQLTQGSGDICGVCIVTCGHHLIVELACTRCLKGPIMLSEAAKVFTRDTLQLVGQDCEVSMRRYPQGMHCDLQGTSKIVKVAWVSEDICKKSIWVGNQQNHYELVKISVRDMLWHTLWLGEQLTRSSVWSSEDIRQGSAVTGWGTGKITRAMWIAEGICERYIRTGWEISEMFTNQWVYLQGVHCDLVENRQD